MVAEVAARVSECEPREAWEGLQSDPAATLVDVRTRAEWSFVGLPDLAALDRVPVLVEWQGFPDMALNPRFAEEVMAQMKGATPARIYFLCRSGARSLSAAHAMAQLFGARGVAVECINIAGGFEGSLDENGHRGARNGWKAAGLDWRQS